MKYLALSAIAVLMFACSDKKAATQDNHSEYFRPAAMTYSKQDTLEITRLVNMYMSCLNNGDLQGCAELLYKVRNDSVLEYDETERADFVENFGQIPVYDCRIKSFLLRDDRNNEVKLLIQMLADGDLLQEVGVTSLSLNPVLQDGLWYLTLLDKNAEGVEDIYQKELEEKRRYENR